jgi:hypothetical protein
MGISCERKKIGMNARDRLLEARLRRTVTRFGRYENGALRAVISSALGLAVLLGTAGAARPQAPESSNPPAPPPSDVRVEVPVPLPEGKKLILKDGTFQLVREYSVDGDRVRYWSLERSDWEEIPSSLVDWDATKKAEADDAQKEKELAEKERERKLAEETAGVDQVDASLEVHPGLLLPDGVGMFALASRQFVPLKQDTAESKIDVEREVEKTLSGVPTVPSRHRIELPGKRSDIRFSTGDLEFFMRTDDQREPRMTLVRAHLRGDARLIETESESVVEDATDQGDEVSTLLWDLAPGVYRFTIDRDLPAGEYAFVEQTADGIDLDVWDFGVDAAGETPHAKTAPSASAKP